ncbi:MAG: L-histidine N(alpha)-methyltransferase, partial [Halofilum sp. (in: g-proteobacteria)]
MARMSTSTEASMPRFTIQTVPPARRINTLAEDVLEGFARSPKELPPKYFYDDRGSALFDRICDTPEYYPMRTEASLLEGYGADIVAAMRPEHIVELGSGTSRKTDVLLGACEQAGIAPVYWPYDVCEGVLQETGDRLLARFPWLQVNALVGDYTAGLDHLPRPAGRCLYVFLGGTLGNFEPEPARVLLSDLTHHMDAGDGLLL